MKNDKIKIARLWSKYEGYITSRSSIIFGLDKDKFETVCVYLSKESDIQNTYTEKDIDVFYASQKKSSSGINLFKIFKLARILKEQKVDILHCHRHKATVHGAIAAKLAGVPVVFSHVHGLNRSKKSKRKLINRIVLKQVTNILTVGEAVRQDVLKNNPFLNPDKVISLGNSIDVNRFSNIDISKENAKSALGLDPKSFVFAAVGRLVPTKGFSYLIEAFAKVKKNVANSELIFAGDGRLKTELESLAEQLGVSSSVHFLGKQSNMPAVFRASDTFVLSSIAEGLPRSMLEAMASGVPVVATNVGGVPEILTSNDLGQIVPPKDIDALAKAMGDLSQMPNSDIGELPQKACSHVKQNYSHSVVIKKLENLYELAYSSATK